MCLLTCIVEYVRSEALIYIAKRYMYTAKRDVPMRTIIKNHITIYHTYLDSKVLSLVLLIASHNYPLWDYVNHINFPTIFGLNK